MKYFEKELLEINKWEHLRKDLFRNEEPEIKLIALTQPLDYSDSSSSVCITSESLPGFTARQSHESKGSYEDDIQLNKKLIFWKHDTPFEAVQYVFHVSGISKSLAGQWTRHRTGIGWTFRSTRYVDASQNKFIYPALEYLNDEKLVRTTYKVYESVHSQALTAYNVLVKNGVKNQEARRLMPVGWSTSAYCYTNARSLRHFFELRLSSHAEWEIRRLAYMMFNILMEHTPSLFEDLYKGE